MNQIDARACVTYMEQLWTNWRPTDAETNFWCGVISIYDNEENVKRAIDEAKKSSDFSKPPAKKLNDLLRVHNMRQRAKVEQPEPTVFLFYEGGGLTKLQAGYFAPVIPARGVAMGEAIESMKLNVTETYGGMWKVYEQTDHSAMIKLRCEMRSGLVDEIEKEISDST